MPESWLPYVPIAALCISVFALFVSGANLGWNIYKEVGLRARIKIWFGIRTIVGPGMKPFQKMILSVTNLGPGVVRVLMIQYRKAGFWRRITFRSERGVIIYDYEETLSAKLPHKLDVGENIDLLLRYGEDSLSSDITHIGINDSYGRVHWVKRKDVREALAQHRKDFPESSTKESNQSVHTEPPSPHV